MPEPNKNEPHSTDSLLKEIVRVAVMAAVVALLTWLQSQGLIAKIDESAVEVKQRVKLSENLVQETVKTEAAAIEEGVTEEVKATVETHLQESAEANEP